MTTKTNGNKNQKRMQFLRPALYFDYLDENGGCRADFLEAKPCTAADVRREVRLGADAFSELSSYVEEHQARLPRVTLLFCDSREEGLLAVQMLQGIALSEEQFEEKMQEEDNPRVIDTSKVYSSAEEQKAFTGEENQVMVLDYRKTASDLENIGHDFDLLSDGERPWFLVHPESPVCIVRSSISDNVNEMFGFGTPEHDEVFDVFSGSRHLYYLIVQQKADPLQEELDVICNAPKGRMDSYVDFVVRYTAGYLRVHSAAKKRRTCLKKVFLSMAEELGLSFGEDVDIDRLLDAILGMDVENKRALLYDALIYVERRHPGKKTFSAEDFEVLNAFDGIGYQADGEKRKLTAEEEFKRNVVFLDDVKAQLLKAIRVKEFNRGKAKDGAACRESRSVFLFLGAPGTAKTTTACYYAKILYERGLAQSDAFLSITGSELCAEYLGQTSHKVHEIFQKGIPVILIDEAYVLTSGSTYAKEALAQLLVEVEAHPEITVILAGYGGPHMKGNQNLMQKLIDSNPGLRSRISEVFYFKNYDAAQMTSIFHTIAKSRGFAVSHEADRELAAYFKRREQDPQFGNGREARSMFEHSRMAADLRIAKIPESRRTDEKLMEIRKEDILAAIDDLSQQNRYRTTGKSSYGLPCGEAKAC